MQEDITIESIQELEFGILCFIKEICEKHNIRYYLAYGTLIGAVRHSGFIPWDDDIDIMMPRLDYQRLLKVLEDNPHPYYQLISYDTHKNFQVPLPKIIDNRTILNQDYDIIESMPLGVYVDIFLMDGAGNDYSLAQRHYNISFSWYKKWKKSRLKLFPSSLSKTRGLLRWIKNIPYKLVGSHYFIKKLTTHNSLYSFDQSNYVATFETGTSDSIKCIWSRDAFDGGYFLEFCGQNFQVPKMYDHVLTLEYGDYMILPPEEKRISHHSYDLKWRDDIKK